jgi:hypothetical protein
MRKGVCLTLVVLIVAGAVAQDFGGGALRQPGAGDYAAETGAALLVGAGATAVLAYAGVAVGIATSPGSEWAGLGGLIIGGAAGVTLGYPLGCGLGATLAGRALDVEGNRGAAYGGAYAGLALGALAGLVSRNWGVGFVGAGVLTPAGAVIGYNTGVSSSLGARIAPPTLAYRSRLGPDQQRYTTFDCRLVTVRF